MNRHYLLDHDEVKKARSRRPWWTVDDGSKRWRNLFKRCLHAYISSARLAALKVEIIPSLEDVVVVKSSFEEESPAQKGFFRPRVSAREAPNPSFQSFGRVGLKSFLMIFGQVRHNVAGSKPRA